MRTQQETHIIRIVQAIIQGQEIQFLLHSKLCLIHQTLDISGCRRLGQRVLAPVSQKQCINIKKDVKRCHMKLTDLITESLRLKEWTINCKYIYLYRVTLDLNFNSHLAYQYIQNLYHCIIKMLSDFVVATMFINFTTQKKINFNNSHVLKYSFQ
jgi:hypothetical protein